MPFHLLWLMRLFQILLTCASMAKQSDGALSLTRQRVVVLLHQWQSEWNVLRGSALHWPCNKDVLLRPRTNGHISVTPVGRWHAFVATVDQWRTSATAVQQRHTLATAVQREREPTSSTDADQWFASATSRHQGCTLVTRNTCITRAHLYDG